MRKAVVVIIMVLMLAVVGTASAVTLSEVSGWYYAQINVFPATGGNPEIGPHGGYWVNIWIDNTWGIWSWEPPYATLITDDFQPCSIENGNLVLTFEGYHLACSPHSWGLWCYGQDIPASLILEKMPVSGGNRTPN
jgi:hypothetical protein